MTESDLTGLNPITHPELATWEWPVAVYLFLGGLVGGLMILVAVLRLRRDRTFDQAVRIADLWALPLLAAGLVMLFLDLSYKLHAWRFFVTFQVTSAMSWGSWILLVAGLVLILRASISLPSTRVMASGRLPRWLRRPITAVGGWAEARSRTLDWASIVVGAALALYTGILLSTIPARPLWDSVVLAPLFLVSGVAAAGAFVCLYISAEAHRRLIPVAISLCGLELALIAAFFATLALDTEATSRALGILGGWPFGAPFWVVVIAGGLLVPLSIETSELRRRSVPPAVSRAAPVLKLIGSAGLRFVIVLAGLQTVM